MKHSNLVCLLRNFENSSTVGAILREYFDCATNHDLLYSFIDDECECNSYVLNIWANEIGISSSTLYNRIEHMLNDKADFKMISGYDYNDHNGTTIICRLNLGEDISINMHWFTEAE